MAEERAPDALEREWTPPPLVVEVDGDFAAFHASFHSLGFEWKPRNAAAESKPAPTAAEQAPERRGGRRTAAAATANAAFTASFTCLKNELIDGRVKRVSRQNQKLVPAKSTHHNMNILY